MDRFSILKNPDQKPCYAYAPTPEERRKIEEEKHERRGRERDLIISQHLQDATGRQRLAASMINPLRQRMNLGSLARRMLSVQTLPDGALPIYPRVTDNPAYVIDEEGQVVHTIVRGDNIFIPMFEISSNSQIPIRQIRDHRFDLIERAQNLAYQNIQQGEESRAINLLRAASIGNTSLVATQFNSEASIIGTLRQAFNNIEGPNHEQRVANIFLNSADYSTIRQHLRSHLDETTPSLWGAQMFVTRGIPPGEIYLTSESLNVGVLPVRTDITVVSADNPEQRSLGWSTFENIGMGCFNSRGVLRVTVPTANHLTRTVETIRHIGFGDEIFDLIPDNVTEIPGNF